MRRNGSISRSELEATMAHELVLTRVIDVPREKLWRCWTEPKLIVLWFTPPPWSVAMPQPWWKPILS